MAFGLTQPGRKTTIYHTWDGNADPYTNYVVVCLNTNLRKFLLWKESLNIDEEQVNQYQQNKQLSLDDGKPGISLRQYSL